MQDTIPAAKRVLKVSKNAIDQEAKGHGDQEEIDSLNADAQTTNQYRYQGGNDAAQGDAEPEEPSQVLYQEGRGHCPDEHKSCLTKRDKPGRAEDPHADSQHDVNAHRNHNVELKRVRKEGKAQQEKSKYRVSKCFAFEVDCAKLDSQRILWVL